MLLSGEGQQFERQQLSQQYQQQQPPKLLKISDNVRSYIATYSSLIRVADLPQTRRVSVVLWHWDYSSDYTAKMHMYNHVYISN